MTASRALSALGLPGDALRNAAIALLAALGIALLVPAVAEVAGRPFRPLAAWAGRRVSARPRAGLAGGLLLGVGLGALWTPCAGPILAAVTVLAAQQRVSADAAAITFAYALGAGLAFLLVALVGQRALGNRSVVRAHAPLLRRISGVALVGAAVLFTTPIPERLATAAPAYTDGLQRLERGTGVRERLDELAGAAPGSAAGRDPRGGRAGRGGGRATRSADPRRSSAASPAGSTRPTARR